MLPRLIGGAALAFGAVVASAQLSPAAPGDARTLPMQFELHREGPVSACAVHCRIWVSAVGMITRDTPADFIAFAKDLDLHGATLALDSSGGSVLGTLTLGRAIRSLDMITTVGKTTRLPVEGSDEALATLSPQADCESMCVFLLLAGKQRIVPPEAQVLVHEIWLGDRRDDAAAATYSAEDIVLVQRDIGRLAQYTVEMGGSIDLLETALRIPPWEPMRKLSSAELRRMGLDTAAGLPDAAGPKAITVSAASPVMPRATATERGWTIKENSDRPALSRRHPLTLEGDEIGNFEVAFGCADTPDSYGVTYFERRQNTDARPSPDALKQVTISVGRRLVPLTIVTSELQTKQAGLDSVARGVVPAELLDSLAWDSSRSLTVVVATTNDVQTAIRVGNTGAAQNLPRLAASCREQATPRADAHAELAPAKAAEAASTAAPE